MTGFQVLEHGYTLVPPDGTFPYRIDAKEAAALIARAEFKEAQALDVTPTQRLYDLLSQRGIEEVTLWNSSKGVVVYGASETDLRKIAEVVEVMDNLVPVAKEIAPMAPSFSRVAQDRDVIRIRNNFAQATNNSSVTPRAFNDNEPAPLRRATVRDISK